MRKFTRSAVSLLLVLVLCACGAGSQWQEQYDLGTRYLNDGNYEEAVIAFTAAIEIDPKRPEAYVGAATAYTALGERQLAIEMLDKAEALLGENDTITAARDELGLSLPLNAYGAIEFTYRPEYIAYEDLSAEEQSWLSAAVSALEAKDKESLLALCGQAASMKLYTTYGQYKVYVDTAFGITLELRPENGMGYWCRTQLIDNGYDHHIVTCPCSDWQWNGNAEYYRERYDPDDDNYLHNEQASYPMVNNLRDGHESEVISGESIYPGGTIHTSSQNRTAEYSQGIKTSSRMQDYDGSWKDLSVDSSFVYGAWCVGYGSPQENPERYYY